jgi:hypothetical protein
LPSLRWASLEEQAAAATTTTMEIEDAREIEPLTWKTSLGEGAPRSAASANYSVSSGAFGRH